MNTIGNDTIIVRKAWTALWRIHKETGNIKDHVVWLKPIIQDYMDPIYFSALIYAVNQGHDVGHFIDSLSPNQTLCKDWLKDELKKVLDSDKVKWHYAELDPPIGKRVQIYGGWYGYPMIDNLLKIIDKVDFIENIDMDPNAIDLCKRIREYKNFNEKTTPRIFGTLGNVLDNNIRQSDLDIVINTSSEHMPPLPEILKDKNPRKECLYVLQSNNMHHIEEHINCVENVDELVESSGIKKVFYKGTKTMPNGYQRFMVIGQCAE